MSASSPYISARDSEFPASEDIERIKADLGKVLNWSTNPTDPSIQQAAMRLQAAHTPFVVRELVEMGIDKERAVKAVETLNQVIFPQELNPQEPNKVGIRDFRSMALQANVG